jgi:transcriptional regulator with XRE-family HTH domain
MHNTPCVVNGCLLNSMTTTGDRIRRARLYRQLSAEGLAQRVGYATQSAITNLENRGTGRGGYKLSQIAQALDVSVQWLLTGPDLLDMAHVPGFDQTVPVHIHEVREDAPSTWMQAGWPFQRISPSQWARLTRPERDLLERQILGLVRESIVV